MGTFLNLSENWIYPQITGVPHVSNRVLCNRLLHRDVFPFEDAHLFLTPPLWKTGFGLPRLCNALARRIGLGGAFLRSKIALWKPDVLHAHFGMRGWESLALKKKLRCKLVVSFYGYDAWLLPRSEPIWRTRYRELFDAGDLFLVEGPAMRDRLGMLGCPENKIVIQHIGVDLASLPFSARNFSVELKIIMVARFVEKKGITDGLRACAMASAQGTPLTVTVVGGSSNEESDGQRINRELREIAQQPELTGRVHFAGFSALAETRALLQKHNVFLCPSKHAASGDAEGGSPVALTEAMATGMLCVGTRHCDIPQVIIDGQTGFLCDEGDVSGLAENLAMVHQNAGKMPVITQRGRQHVEEFFALPKQMSQLRFIYGEK